MGSKTCSMCEEEKSLDSFYKSIGGSLGRGSRCKPCATIANKAYKDAKRKGILNGEDRYVLRICEVCYKFSHTVHGPLCSSCSLVLRVVKGSSKRLIALAYYIEVTGDTGTRS